MDDWLSMLRSTYNWNLADRINQYYQQFIQGEYCDIKTKAEACPLTCFVSKNGATGEPWKDSKTDKDGNLKNPRRSAVDIQITTLPQLKKSRPWFGEIDSTVLQRGIFGGKLPPKICLKMLNDWMWLTKTFLKAEAFQSLRIGLTLRLLHLLLALKFKIIKSIYLKLGG